VYWIDGGGWTSLDRWTVDLYWEVMLVPKVSFLRNSMLINTVQLADISKPPFSLPKSNVTMLHLSLSLSAIKHLANGKDSKV
jgi:hypothetical protein